MTTIIDERQCQRRGALERRTSNLMHVNPALKRSLVSFQANKAEPFYGWFKYKEGFSSALVRYCLETLSPKCGTMLDPFAGAGAALFASRDLGWNAVGIELLPVGFYAMQARQAAEGVNAALLATEVRKLIGEKFETFASPEGSFRHLRITAGAFSPETEKALSGFLSYCNRRVKDTRVRELFRFACFCILEEISFTRKDGQYLRWDHRNPQNRTKTDFNKGRIIPFDEAVRAKLDRMASDLSDVEVGLFRVKKGARGHLDLRKGSCLEILPTMDDGSVDFVLTSPPYCNRYDYTRTYALELAFLGYGEEEVKSLRQAMLSCTVENKAKVEALRELYTGLGQSVRFDRVSKVFAAQAALHEVLDLLDRYRDEDKLNNSNVPRMVRNYFFEMSFVIYELARLVAPGGKIVMVNDNVRYAGEEVPVDLILSDLAKSFGLKVAAIWVLPRGKGNSSQQMGSHGREELRKCVYVWEKP